MLHQRLLASTQRDFEKLHGRVGSPGALLQLAVNDALFAWLRPLSERIAALDEAAGSDELDAAGAQLCRETIAGLLEQPGEFHDTYLVYLQSDPDVVMAHADVRALLYPPPRIG